jgi:acyl-CoA thioester hydrolase
MTAFRVYIEDTDMMGVVFYANYLKFFERARTEWLRERGFSLSELAKEHIGFAVRHVDIHYIAPARIDDLLILKTDVLQTGYCQLQFKQKMMLQNQKPIAEACVDVVCVNQNMMPRRLPRQICEECLK